MPPNPLPVAPVPREACDVEFVRSSGPGGQNVNKVSSKVRLRVDLSRLGLAPDSLDLVRSRLASRLDAEGRLVVESQATRDQHRNLDDALHKAGALVAAASHVPKSRRPTRPTHGSRVRRLDAKRRQSQRKESRSSRPDHE